MPAHFSGNMGENFVTIFEADPKERVGKSFQHNAFYLNAFFFSH